MAKAYTDTWLTKFKGVNYNPPEQAKMEDETFPVLENFNVNVNGYLEKRRGAVTQATIAGLGTTRVLGIARDNPATFAAQLVMTDGANCYRAALPGVGAPTQMLQAGNPLTSVMYMVEYGTPATPYYNYILRSAGAPNGMYRMANVGAGYAVTLLANSPTGTHMSVFKDRGWVCNSYDTTGTESRVWYSAAGDLTNWGGVGLPQNIDFNPGDGDYVVATVPYNDTLIIFKSRKTYVLYADGSPTSWTVRLLNNSIGCTGRESIQVINGFIYFLSADGVYKTDGTTFQLISDNVRSLTSQNRDYRNPANVVELYSAYWDDKYILWIPGANNTQPIVWDLRSETWTRWLFAGSVDITGTARYNEYSPDTLYLGGRATNKIWALGPSTYQDAGVNYTARLTTRTMEFGEMSSLKRNHLFYLDTAPNFNTAESITVSYRADENAVSTTSQATDINYRRVMKYRGAGYFRTLQTTISYTGQYLLNLYGFGWANEVRARIRENVPT